MTLLLSIFLLIPSFVFSGELHLMTYNVQNLFDTIHDQGKDDYEYLPFTHPEKVDGCLRKDSERRKRTCLNIDFTPAKLQLKINQIADAILCSSITVDTTGKLVKNCNKKRPHILALTEVENINVLRMLQKRLGYNGVLMGRSNDRRGIDVAYLYDNTQELRLVDSREYFINPFLANTQDPQLERLKGVKLTTRSIVEAVFKVNNATNLYVYVNHWPSQSPTHLDLERSAFAKMQVSIIQQRLSRDKMGHAITMGDYNVIDRDEYPHSFRDILLNRRVGALVDSHDAFMNSPYINWKDKLALPLGTYYYAPKREWNRLDRILIDRGLLAKRSGLRLDNKKEKFYQIVAPSFLRWKGLYGPYRYNFNELSPNTAGYSDHFPVELKLTY